MSLYVTVIDIRDFEIPVCGELQTCGGHVTHPESPVSDFQQD